MQLDPATPIDEEVDIETRERPGTGYGNRGNNGDQHSNGNGVVNVDDDEEKEDDEDDEEEEDDDGDEETFAVEKVLSHRIGKKTNVGSLPFPLFLSSHFLFIELCGLSMFSG
jgi:hypothetical protein